MKLQLQMCFFLNSICKVQQYLQEVDVVLSAVQLLEAGLLFLQLVNLLFQTLDQSLGLVESGLLVDTNQLGHLRPHPFNGADHVLKHLLALHHGSLGRVLRTTCKVSALCRTAVLNISQQCLFFFLAWKCMKYFG